MTIQLVLTGPKSSSRFWVIHCNADDVTPSINTLVWYSPSIFGCTAAVHWVDADALMVLVPVVLIIVALYFALAKNVGRVERQARINEKQYVYGVVPAIGFYDGFFGPGTGSFFSFANVALMGRNIISATANAKSLNFASNIASLIVFLFSGHIVWMVAAVMLSGQVVGAYLGSRLVISHGQKIIRPIIVIMCLSMCGKILLERLNS